MANHKPLLIGVRLEDCYLRKLLSHSNAPIVMRVIRIMGFDNRIELYIVIHAKKSLVRALSRNINKMENASFTILYSERSVHLVVMSFPRSNCRRFSKCPLAGSFEGFVPLSSGIMGREVVGVGLALSRKVVSSLREHGLEVFEISSNAIQKPLTKGQRWMLFEAFRNGYYEYPRRISLKDLAKRLGMSVSAAAEKLRKAEVKAINNYILENIIVEVFLDKIMEGSSPPISSKVDSPKDETGYGHNSDTGPD
ncbi:MAG: helix-turn-helix domain-containing protein [Desulfurococcales archaeon]|nr:helix-turn-helix domain-containing protein [Desulfurococcales archaeon]